MKQLVYLFAMITFTFSVYAQNNGVTATPTGKEAEPTAQIQIRFPESVTKADAFSVACVPDMKGAASWADNNTLWTYNFKADEDFSIARLAGGSTCKVTQTTDVTGASGKVWKKDSLSYEFTVAGPKVVNVIPGYGFDGNLREKEPVVLILFNGDVDKDRFFAESGSYLSYQSNNAPAEKIPLIAVPADKQEEVFKHFAQHQWLQNAKYTDKNWVLATIGKSLVTGAEVAITVQNAPSSYNKSTVSSEKHVAKFAVRSDFRAQLRCDGAEEQQTCLPQSPITIAFNGKVKWSDAQAATIEYVPYLSQDGKTVTANPTLRSDQNDGGYLNQAINYASQYVTSLAKFSDTTVDSITFDVRIEPETEAKVKLPATLADIEGRQLKSSSTEFVIRIGTMREMIKVPNQVSVFEKNIDKVSLPVGIINLNQRISIRKTGTSADNWAGLQDMDAIVKVIRAYEILGESRETPTYRSPLEDLGMQSSVVETQMTGTKNRYNFLQFPFGEKAANKTGFYVMEVSSPTYEDMNSSKDSNSYMNPLRVMAQVTDLAVHVKQGARRSLVWVTSLSTGEAVANASIEIYNCLGEKALAVTSDKDGLAGFDNQEWAKDCNAAGKWSQYLQKDSYYVVARTADDFAFTHSSWVSSNSYAYNSPGVEYVYSQMTEKQPFYHAIVGVNLVKPGQKVPVEIIARVPEQNGFSMPDDKALATHARIYNINEPNTYYEFPLSWTNGVATLEWSVPADSSFKLGLYNMSLVVPNSQEGTSLGNNASIEVAEFKVPLMSGKIAFPAGSLVKPKSIPVNASIRYANGVGAKDLKVSLSYYFQPTNLNFKDYSEFSFGSGPAQSQADNATPSELPSYERPISVENLTTDKDGSVTVDVLQEKLGSGKTIGEVLNEAVRPQRLVARFRYQDQIGEFQTLSQAKDIYNSNYYVGAKVVGGEVAKAQFQAVAVSTEGKAVTSKAKPALRVYKIETKVIGEELYGGLIKETVEREYKLTDWKGSCSTVKDVLTCAIGTLPAGAYAVEVTTKDNQAANAKFKVGSDGTVYGEDEYYYFGDEESQKVLPLALNKPMYKDGDKVVVSFPAPFKACRALVTVERNDVLQSFIVPNACQKGQVEVRANAELAPNAYVSVYAISPRDPNSLAANLSDLDLGRPTYRMGFANLKVDWSRYQANVKVNVAKAQYKPGDMVEAEVTVAADQGTLTNATVTVVAIEEKLLELRGNETYKILESMMQMRGHGVTTLTPLERIESLTAKEADKMAKEAAQASADARKGGGEGGDGSSATELRRKLFDALVTFQANVPVQNGKAKVSFKANDSLTRFKVLAIATSADQKFGMGEGAYLTTQEVQTFSNIPSVAYTGDAYPVIVNVQNNSKADGTYNVEVVATVKDSKGQVIDTKTLTKSQAVKKASATGIDVGQFAVSEDAASISYVVRVTDAKGKLVDQLQPEPQVISPAVPLAIRDSFIKQTVTGVMSVDLTKEANAQPNKGEIRTTVSTSLVSGSLEQMSARLNANNFSDFFIESRIYNAFLKGSDNSKTELAQVLSTLVSYVDGQGVVKYYPQAERGDLSLTANIIQIMQDEKWAMDLVPTTVTAQWKEVVRKVLDRTIDPNYVGKEKANWLRAQMSMGIAAYAFGDSALEALAAKALADIKAELKRDANAYGVPMEKWNNDSLADMFLLEAMVEPSAAQKSAALAILKNPARLVYVGNAATLLGKPAFWLEYLYSDEIIETSKLLYAHARIGGGADMARALATGLVNSSSKAWYVSRTMGWVAKSLRRFSASYEAEAVAGTAKVTLVNQGSVADVDFAQNATATVKNEWTSPKETVKVTHAGQGQPWVAVQALSAVKLTQAVSQGVSVDKVIRNVNRQDGFQVGDMVEVTLKINSPAVQNHMAIFDPIPAGANIMADAYGFYSSGEKSYRGYKLYFAHLPAGQTTVQYQYQLNNPGDFKLPPTRIEGLYMPSEYGEAPNAGLQVAPAGK